MKVFHSRLTHPRTMSRILEGRQKNSSMLDYDHTFIFDPGVWWYSMSILSGEITWFFRRTCNISFSFKRYNQGAHETHLDCLVGTTIVSCSSLSRTGLLSFNRRIYLVISVFFFSGLPQRPTAPYSIPRMYAYLVLHLTGSASCQDRSREWSSTQNPRCLSPVTIHVLSKCHVEVAGADGLLRLDLIIPCLYTR